MVRHSSTPHPRSRVFDTALFIAVAVAFGAGVIRGFAGFGTPLFLAPLFAVLWGPTVMVPLVIVLEVVLSTVLVPMSWRDAKPSDIAPIWLGTVVFVPLGTWLLGTVDPNLIKRLVGVVVLGFAIASLAGWRYRGPRGLAMAGSVGAVGGVLAGLIGFAGPPVLIYVIGGPDPMARIRANLILYFGGTAIVVFASAIVAGLVTPEIWQRFFVLCPVVLVGMWIGARFFRHAGDALARRVALILLVLAGLAGLAG